MPFSDNFQSNVKSSKLIFEISHEFLQTLPIDSRISISYMHANIAQDSSKTDIRFCYVQLHAVR